MQFVIPIFKPIGPTPLEMIKQFRVEHPEYAYSKIGYAGRLDPMASGLLLFLIDHENANRKIYEKLSKIYTFDLIFGIETDTYDALGLIQNRQYFTKFPAQIELQQKLDSILTQMIGYKEQAYPPYSSPRINGKPLFYWARHNLLHTITIPKKIITITSIGVLKSKVISLKKLKNMIINQINKVRGDFRQDQILATWQALELPFVALPVFHCQVACSSGTYIRSLAHEIGQKMNFGAIACNIQRTRIGNYSIDSLGSI